MNNNYISDFFIKADQFADCIPILSTATNLLNIFQKFVIPPFIEKKSIANGHFYTYLNQKSFVKCLILLIPGLGNFMIGIPTMISLKWDNKNYVLEKVKKEGWQLEHVSERLKNDPDVVREAVEKTPYNFIYASEELRKNKSFILSIKNKTDILKYIDSTLSKDREVVRAAFEYCPSNLKDASEDLKNDYEFMLSLIQENEAALHHLGEKLKDDKKFILEASQYSENVAKHTSKRLFNDISFMFDLCFTKGVKRQDLDTCYCMKIQP